MVLPGEDMEIPVKCESSLEEAKVPHESSHQLLDFQLPSRSSSLELDSNKEVVVLPDSPSSNSTRNNTVVTIEDDDTSGPSDTNCDPRPDINFVIKVEGRGLGGN